MPLSPLNWRLLPPVTVNVGGAVHTLLDAIYTMGTSTTYADGSARTPGSGSAWTWTRDQTVNPGLTTAAVGIPPINALNMGYIVAGDTSARTPTMNTDAWATGSLFVGMNKNSGAYAAWNAAAPFTSGQFSGLIRNVSTASLSLTGVASTMFMIESQEGFLVAINRTDAASEALLGGGALIDPLSGGAANGETDGRLYSILTSGQLAFVPTTWLNAGAGPFNSTTSAGDAHWYTFNVGAVATTRNTAKIGNFSALSSGLLAPSGEVPSIPFSAYFPTSGQFAGQYRQIGVTQNGITGAEKSQAGTRKGYTVGYSTQAVGASVLLSY